MVDGQWSIDKKAKISTDSYENENNIIEADDLIPIAPVVPESGLVAKIVEKIEAMPETIIPYPSPSPILRNVSSIDSLKATASFSHLGNASGERLAKEEASTTFKNLNSPAGETASDALPPTVEEAGQDESPNSLSSNIVNIGSGDSTFVEEENNDASLENAGSKDILVSGSDSEWENVDRVVDATACHENITVPQGENDLEKESSNVLELSNENENDKASNDKGDNSRDQNAGSKRNQTDSVEENELELDVERGSSQNTQDKNDDEQATQVTETVNLLGAEKDLNRKTDDKESSTIDEKNGECNRMSVENYI